MSLKVFQKSVFLVAMPLFLACGPERSPQEIFTAAQQALEAKEYERAIQCYRQLLKEYPGDENCDKAQFMIGLIYAENLQNLKKAREAFLKILEKYPHSDLADDACRMLENMNRNPEEIIPLGR